MTRYDAVVVGARVAGAATALLLARQGARVLVVDRAPAGTDTLSTHALMRGGVLQLERWGVLDALVAGGTPPIRRTTFHYGDETVPIDIEPLYAPRRTVLDPLLVRAARDAGAEVRHGVTVRGLVRDGERVRGVLLDDGREVLADVVVGADGRGSLVAREVGADVLHRGTHASGMLYGHFAGLDLDGTHWLWAEGSAAGVIPTNDGHACVFVGTDRERFVRLVAGGRRAAFDHLVGEQDPWLRELLAGRQPAQRLRGYGGEPALVRACTGPGWALVGDAGAIRDPITAHGMTDALRDAELLAASPADYPALREAASHELIALTDTIAGYRWTLPEVSALHRDLSRAMKRTTGLMEGRLPPCSPSSSPWSSRHTPAKPRPRPTASPSS